MLGTLKIFSLVLIIVNLVLGEKIRYDNYTVYRVTPQNEATLRNLRLLEENPGEYKFWAGVSVIGKDVDIMVPPYMKGHFNSIVYALDAKTEVFIQNVQTLIEGERGVRNHAVGDIGWTDYYELNEINQWLNDLPNRYPGIVTAIKGGDTYEGRDIVGVKISFADTNSENTVVIEGNIHAREWITSAFVTYFINDLLTTNDADLSAIAKSHDWYIFPVTNPDGFAYTHTTDRMWRKTRKPYSGGCFGADPNRNWDYHYNDGGTSDSPCSETYRGTEAFSEENTKTLSNFIATLGPNLKAYLAFHSYSQIMLFPYGYTTDQLDNYNELNRVAAKAVGTLADRYGTRYTYGNVAEAIYIASGGSMDWVKGTFGTPITYTYELRDTGRYGFLLPANQIIPTALETIDSLVTIFKEFE